MFISYAWDPKEGIPPGFEVPVEAIREYLRELAVQPIRDRDEVRRGDDLLKFMEWGATRPHFIAVHSDRYWRSPHCVFEFWTMLDGLTKKAERTFQSVVIPVEHLQSNVRSQAGVAEYLKYWEEYQGTPTKLGWTDEDMRLRAAHTIDYVRRELDRALEFNIVWSAGEAKALAEIGRRLGLGMSAPAAGRRPGK